MFFIERSRAMLSAIIIVALIAKIHAGIPEYSKDTIEAVQLSKMYATTTPAELINPDIELEIGGTPSPDEAFVLEVSPERGQAPKDSLRGNFLGLKLTKTGDTFCYLFAIDLEDSYLLGEIRIPQIYLIFTSNETGMFQLDVPIFVKPAKYESKNKQDQFKKWAIENKVGTLSQVDVQKIKDIGNRKPVKLDFKWLSQLLKFGISKDNSRLSDDQYYYARPIVVSKEQAEDILATIDSLDISQ